MNIFPSRVLSLLAGCFITMNVVPFAVHAEYPLFKMDSNGNAVTVWQDTVDDGVVIRANTCIAGVWGNPQIVMSGGVVTQSPIIEVNAIGTDDISAVIVWADSAGDSSTGLYAAMLSSASDNWTSVTPIPLDENENVNSDYVLKVHADGTVVLVYTSTSTGTTKHCVKSIRSTISRKNTWSTPEIISGS